MIRGRTHHQLVLEILSDGKPHFSRELIDAGLCEYRQPIDKLRKKGFIIEAISIQESLFGHSRPGFILKGKREAQAA